MPQQRQASMEKSVNEFTLTAGDIFTHQQNKNNRQSFSNRRVIIESGKRWKMYFRAPGLKETLIRLADSADAVQIQQVWTVSVGHCDSSEEEDGDVWAPQLPPFGSPVSLPSDCGDRCKDGSGPAWHTAEYRRQLRSLEDGRGKKTKKQTCSPSHQYPDKGLTPSPIIIKTEKSLWRVLSCNH